MGKLKNLTQVRGVTPCWLHQTGHAAATAPVDPSFILKRAVSLALVVLVTFSVAGAQVPDCAPASFRTTKCLARSSVSYIVDVRPKGKPISGATLQMQFGEITGAGEAKVDTEICPLAASADNCGAPELKLQVVLSTGPARKVSDTGQLNGSTRQLRVVHLLSVAAGKGGTASFNGFMAIFHGQAAHRGSQARVGHSQAGISAMSDNIYYVKHSELRVKPARRNRRTV
jgi:hypothetical protein